MTPDEGAPPPEKKKKFVGRKIYARRAKNGALVERHTTLQYWLNGCLSYLLRPNGQRWFYDFLNSWKKQNPQSYGPVVVFAHRHLGKSTGGVIYLIERCLQEPSNVIFLAPKHNQCERILRQPLRKILYHCPREIQTRWRGPVLSIKNPMWGDSKAESTFQYLGADKDDGSHLRGCGGQNVIFLDEVRDNANLEYLVKSVLSFSFQKQNNPLLVMITTPPDSLDHPLTRPGGFLERAKSLDSFLEIRGDKNPDVSKSDEESILSLCGGDRSSDFFRREFLCELIQNSDLATCREYSPMRSVIEVEEYTRPVNHDGKERFFPLIVADMGWEPDPTAILAGYVDFQQQILVVENERLIKRASTGEFAAAVEALERETFPNAPFQVRRFADANNQQLDDFWREERVQFASVDKYDRRGALARMRTVVAEGRLRILPRCKHLRYQLLTGLLDRRGELARTESLGHQDCTAALIYMVRMAPWLHNPFEARSLAGPDRFILPGTIPEQPGVLVDTAASHPGLVRRGGITIRRHQPLQGG